MSLEQRPGLIMDGHDEVLGLGPTANGECLKDKAGVSAQQQPMTGGFYFFV